MSNLKGIASSFWKWGGAFIRWIDAYRMNYSHEEEIAINIENARHKRGSKFDVTLKNGETLTLRAKEVACELIPFGLHSTVKHGRPRVGLLMIPVTATGMKVFPQDVWSYSTPSGKLACQDLIPETYWDDEGEQVPGHWYECPFYEDREEKYYARPDLNMKGKEIYNEINWYISEIKKEMERGGHSEILLSPLQYKIVAIVVKKNHSFSDKKIKKIKAIGKKYGIPVVFIGKKITPNIYRQIGLLPKGYWEWIKKIWGEEVIYLPGEKEENMESLTNEILKNWAFTPKGQQIFENAIKDGWEIHPTENCIFKNIDGEIIHIYFVDMDTDYDVIEAWKGNEPCLFYINHNEKGFYIGDEVKEEEED